jgi:hypothetical protein
MNSLVLQPVSGLFTDASSLVSQTPTLNCFFSAIHTVHKWWRWKQDAELVYEYFNHPALALGDIVAHHFAKDNVLYTVIAVALGVIRSLWEAENARRLLIRDFHELKWQIMNPTVIPFHPTLLASGMKSVLLAVAFKVQLIFTFTVKVVYQSLCLSMHLIDLYQYFSSQEQQNRAKKRFFSNAFFLHQETRPILSRLQGPSDLPFFNKMGINTSYIDKLHESSQTLTKLLPVNE